MVLTIQCRLDQTPKHVASRRSMVNPGVEPVAIKLEDKKAIVAEVNEAAKGALSAVVADARGVSVSAMTGLRKDAREAGVYVRVVRNTLLRRAVAGTQFENLSETFTGDRKSVV